MDPIPKENEDEKPQKSTPDLIHQRIGDQLYETFADADHGEFYKRVASNESAMNELATRPEFIHELAEYRGEIFDDPKKFESFFRNSKERQQALNISEIGLQLRLRREPFASEEEVAAGVYKEFLEPQVRDAVFAVRRKGYGTFESGFYNIIEGSQYLGFPKGTLKNLSLSPEKLETLRTRGIELSVDTITEDRDSIFLKPTRDFDLDQWKKIWDEVTEIFPDRGMPAPSGDNEELIEKQENMKAEKRVYLGTDLFYEKGKVFME